MNDVLEKYDELDKLGSGNFGTVYKVRNKILDRVEALKIINGVTPNDYKKQLEAKVQHKLKHDNIVEIYDAYVRNSKLYISMEYLDGGTLEKKAKDEYLTVKNTIKYMIDCLYGLQHIHNNGFIHRDLKPNNVLMNDITVKLSDFGLTDEMDDDRELKTRFGYSYHRSPEVYKKGAYCEQSDIYALGLTAYRLLNGDNFIKKEKNIDNAIITGTFPPRDNDDYRLDVPKKLIDIINTALDVNLNDRYKYAHHFRKALQGVSIPIDWILSSNRDNKQVWMGSRGAIKYKIEVTKKLLSDKFSIEMFKGTNTLRKVSKHCQYDIDRKKINNQVRKMLTKEI